MKKKWVEEFTDLVQLFTSHNKQSKVEDNLEIIKKAHALGKYTVREIIEGQRAYQNWLFQEFHQDISSVMRCHRSVGFEFEFATYRSQTSFKSHTLLGSSSQHSALFSSRFKLETDFNNELELGFPPFLILNRNTSTRKESIWNIWNRIKHALFEISQSAVDCPLSHLFYLLKENGMGDNWFIYKDYPEIFIAKRRKHWEKECQVYSQLNINLQPKEIASFIRNYGVGLYGSQRHEYFKETYLLLYSVCNASLQNDMEKNWCTLFCRGLANLLAIPSLLLLKENPESTQNNRGVYSSVKEVFGIWVKDSFLNIMDNSVQDRESRQKIIGYLTYHEEAIGEVMQRQVEKAVALINTLTNFSENYGKAAMLEYALTLRKTKERLAAPKPVLKKNQSQENYRFETFPSDGNGVRKETFINLPNCAEQYTHLSELRNDIVIKLFLSKISF